MTTISASSPTRPYHPIFSGLWPTEPERSYALLRSSRPTEFLADRVEKLFDVDAAVVHYDVYKDDIYMVTHKNKARYEITRTNLKKPDMAHAAVMVPASELVIQEVDVRKTVFTYAISTVALGACGGSHSMANRTYSGRRGSIGVGNFCHAHRSWRHRARCLLDYLSAMAPLRCAAKTASDTGIQPPLPIDTSSYEAVEVKPRAPMAL